MKALFVSLGALVHWLFAFHFLLVSATQPPSVRILISQHGLDYLSEVAEDILQKELKKLETLRVEQRGKYAVHDIEIKRLVLPKFDTQLVPNEQAVSWSATLGNTKLRARWDLWKKILWKKRHFRGWLEASANSARIAIKTTINKDSKGLPRVAISSCQAQLNNFKVKIGGGVLGWIANLFRKKIAKKFRQNIEAAICKEAREGLKKLNGKIVELPNRVKLFEDFQLDYSLATAPRIHSTQIEANFIAHVTYKGDAASAVALTTLPMFVPTTRMLAVYGGDYVINSLLNVAYRHGRLTELINGNKLSMLKTTCDGICIGTLIWELSEEHPNKRVDIVVSAIAPPQVFTQANGTQLSCNAEAKFYVHPESGGVPLFTVSLQLLGRLSVSLASNSSSIKGEMNVSQFSVQVIQSSIGDIDPDALSFVEPMLQPFINSYLAKGMPVPMIGDKVRLISPTLEQVDRALQIETDLAYTT